eukprot:Hpha_TRINITY_DN34524_c0_g1::TRINITY_DN34524_c0_g1_i1::g.96413::m.96413/K07107/ybgC; acyl-CoA thioester hydrolase
MAVRDGRKEEKRRTAEALLDNYKGTYYPWREQLEVRWGDMDLMGHVNNVMYFRYSEQARLGHLNSMWKANNVILAETSSRFRRPLVYPDTVTCGVQSKLHDDGYSIIQRVAIASHQQGLVAAEVTARLVLVGKDGKKILIPDDLRRIIEKDGSPPAPTAKL